MLKNFPCIMSLYNSKCEESVNAPRWLTLWILLTGWELMKQWKSRLYEHAKILFYLHNAKHKRNKFLIIYWLFIPWSWSLLMSSLPISSKRTNFKDEEEPTCLLLEKFCANRKVSLLNNNALFCWHFDNGCKCSSQAFDA